MRPSGRKALLAAVCALAVMAQAAWADDLYAPAYRGMTGSTTQEWDFITAGTPRPQSTYYYDAPDGTGGITNNPFAKAQGTAAQAWIYGGAWQGGMWSNADVLEFSIPDDMAAGPGTWKDLRLQVTFLAAAAVEPEVMVYHGSQDFSPISSMVYDLGGGRYQLVQDWRTEPNPIQEYVEVTHAATGFAVDQVVIDTICTPEPATLCFLGAGLAGLVTRRLRRK